MELYPYQQLAVRDISYALRDHQKVVYVLPTGGGKTVIAGELARGREAKGTRSLFLVHRKELVDQAVNTLREFLPDTCEIGIEAAGFPRTPWATIHVGMVQSIVNRLDTFKAPRFIFVDEAHHARANTWELVLKSWPDAYVIGLTATPERLDGRGLAAHFNVLLEGPSSKDLIDGDYLAPLRVLRPTLADLTGTLRVGSNGDYMRSDVDEQWEANRERLAVNSVDAYLRYAKGRRAIFFGRNINHSQDVAARFCSMGIPAEHVDGTTARYNRDASNRRFRDGKTKVLCNVRLFDEGFDVPACDCVIIGFPTKSMTRWRQACGRSMRWREGKVALVLDTEGVSHDLGLPTDPIEWSLEDGHVDTKKRRKRESKTCSECATVHYSALCPNCYGTQTDDIAEIELELEEATEAPPPRHRKLSRSELNVRLAQIHNEPRECQLDALRQLAVEIGYKPGWVNVIRNLWGL